MHFLFRRPFRLLMHLFSHFFFVNLSCRLNRFSLLTRLYTHNWILLTILGRVQNPLFCICPSWSGLFDLISDDCVSALGLTKSGRHTGLGVKHRSILVASLSIPSMLHRHLPQALPLTPFPKEQTDYQQLRHRMLHLHLLD